MRMTKKKLGPIFDLKEGRREPAMARAVEAEGEEEEDIPHLVRKARKMVAPWKRKQATSGSSSTPKRQR